MACLVFGGSSSPLIPSRFHKPCFVELSLRAGFTWYKSEPKGVMLMQNICKNLIDFMFPAAPKDPGYKASAPGRQTVAHISSEENSPELEPESPAKPIIT